MKEPTAGQVRRREVARTWTSAGPFAAIHLACVFVVVFPPTVGLLGLAAAGYALRMWALTAGFHRYFAHRAFRTGRTFQLVLAIAGCTAMQQGPLWWASWHRRHHHATDAPGDPHSPRLDGFWHAHVGWIFDGKHDSHDGSNVRDLAAYPELRWLNRHANVPVAVYAAACLAIAGPAGVVWGFVVSTVALMQATFLVNSVAHVWGTRRFDTPDGSRNNAIVAILTFGEGWHNNHHRYMTSARQGLRWWEVDVTYYTLRALAWLGVVRDLRQPPLDRDRRRPRAALA
ncbi:MAG: acyl-CoA desaturase [Deltaproteobacteria bacterium]|nr:acyl-CoA desaturase [Deltaproteobacteria bacterium]MCW5808690.1 acyl-CoA desaturase [Deltaproteobacteria bacterium]